MDGAVGSPSSSG